MKRLLVLSLLCIACVSSAIVADVPAVPTATQAASSVSVCAVVTASDAVNVRDENHHVIGQLSHGEVVTVRDGVGDWWQVDGASVSGRVRALYLQLVACP